MGRVLRDAFILMSFILFSLDGHFADSIISILFFQMPRIISLSFSTFLSLKLYPLVRPWEKEEKKAFLNGQGYSTFSR
jgi:hypothetical protein